MSVTSVLTKANEAITTLEPAVIYRRKLNAAAAMQARLLYATGHSKAEIARRLGCSAPNITKVVTRQTWKHV